MNIVRNPSEAAIKEILVSAQLPTSDIRPEHMEHFFGAWSGSALVGVVGIEPYGTVALLRSLAVVAPKRGSGVGSRLLALIEQYATEREVRSMFLLTTTAESYFGKRGYLVAPRKAAPEAIRSTKEFASICPSSAVLMVKHMSANPALSLTHGTDAPFAG